MLRGLFSRTRSLRPRRRLLGEYLEDRCVLAAIMMSAEEQLMIELINRARANPVAEAALHGIDLNEGLAAGTISSAPKQPLAPHQSLSNAAGDHADDMLARDYFSHTTLGTNLGPGDRARAAGYPAGAAENISWGGSTAPIDELAHVYERHHRLFLSKDHRVNMLTESWEDVGTGVRFGLFATGGNTYNASMVVENFGSAVGGKITGVAYDEAAVVDNNNPDAGIYNVGEGLGGLTITARDAAGNVYTTTTGPSGGYELAAPAGTYTVTATGGALGNAVITQTGVRHRLNAFENTKVDFEMGDAVGVGPLTINGTAGSDTMTVRPKPGDPNSIEVLFGALSQGTYANDSITEILINAMAGDDRVTLEAGVPHNVTIDAGAGDDTVVFSAGAGAQTVVMRPTSTEMTGDGPDVTVRNSEETRVSGDAADFARLYDSNADDRFYGRPAYSYLTGSSFYNRANGFGKVYAYATAGGLDRAYLYDSAGDDRFYGKPTLSYLYGDDFYNRATSFDYVYAYATAGGLDRAYLYDSAGDDRFYGKPTLSYLYGDDFYNRATAFDYVYAYATAGGLDRAYLYDSAGDDRFYGKPTLSYLYGDDFYNRATAFDYVYAYATAGGLDQAYLYDSAGDDRFYGKPTLSYLYGDDFYNRATAFDYVYAYATAGGLDKAYLYDSAGNDKFVGRSTYSSLTGDTFSNYVSSFDYVYAYATGGGVDSAYLFDSAGDDRFSGKLNFGYLTGAGFYNNAKGFDTVKATAGRGVDQFDRVDPLSYTLIQSGDWEL